MRVNVGHYFFSIPLGLCGPAVWGHLPPNAERVALCRLVSSLVDKLFFLVFASKNPSSLNPAFSSISELVLSSPRRRRSQNLSSLPQWINSFCPRPKVDSKNPSSLDPAISIAYASRVRTPFSVTSMIKDGRVVEVCRRPAHASKPRTAVRAATVANFAWWVVRRHTNVSMSSNLRISVSTRTILSPDTLYDSLPIG
jgi:hypothetical protein